jgi:hypothetical protein
MVLETAGLLANPITRRFGTKMIAARPFLGGATTGGIIGGITGAGGNEEDRLGGALAGGLTGGLIGGPTSYLGSLATQKLGPAMVSGYSKLRELLQPTARTAQQQADDVLRPFMQKGFDSTDEAVARARQLGPQGTLMDMSPEMAGVGSSAYNLEIGGMKSSATKLFLNRSKNAANRINGKISRLFGKKGQQVGTEIKAAIQSKADEAAPLFEQARGQSVSFPQMNTYLQTLDDKIAQAEGTSFARALKSTRKALFKTNPDKTKIAKTSVDDLMKVRDDLADKASAAFRKGNVKLWRFLKDARNEFDDMLMPESYKEGNRILSARHDLLDATDLGEKFYTQKTADLLEWTANASDAERQAYLMGLVNATKEKMGKVPQTGTPSKIFNSFNFKEKLTAVLGDPKKADDFVNMVETENIFKATENLVKGNSITAARQEATDLFRNALGKAQGSSPMSRSEALQELGRKLLGALKLQTSIKDEVAKSIENRLTTQGVTEETVKMLMATPAREAFKQTLVNWSPTVGYTGAAASGLMGGELQGP